MLRRRLQLIGLRIRRVMVEWTTACPDWEERILERKSLVPFDPLFPDEAAAALDVFNDLHIVDLPGRPTIGQVCRPWLLDLPKALFGSYDAKTGRRLIREYMLLVSKKNWKSGVAAAVMLTALIRNWRDSAEFLIVAPTVEVANNSFTPAADMVRANDLLWVENGGFLRVQPNFRTITNINNGATLKVIAADSETVGGKKATGIFVDELWLFGDKANAENMFREVIGGLTSRPEGFVVYVSTQSDKQPAGIFRQKLEYFRAVRDGKIEDKRSLGILYEYPKRVIERELFRDEKYWYITNPNLGASADPEFIRDQYRKAEAAGPASFCGFAAKHLNVEIGISIGSTSWAGAEFWESCADKTLTLDTLLARSEVVVVGIDGGGLDDLLGLAVLGRCRETRKWLVWCKAWAHRVVLERRKEVAPRLLDFEKAGQLTIVNSPGDDVTEVADIITGIDELGLLAGTHSVAVDAAGIGDIIDALTGRGFSVDRIAGIQQGWKLTGAIKTTERKLAGGELVHDGSELMAWCVGNAKVEPRGNAVTITKATAGSAKIDPLAALFDAVSLMAMNPSAQSKSPWEEESYRLQVC